MFDAVWGTLRRETQRLRRAVAMRVSRPDVTLAGIAGVAVVSAASSAVLSTYRLAIVASGAVVSLALVLDALFRHPPG